MKKIKSEVSKNKYGELKVGDLVTTDWLVDKEDIVRKITTIYTDNQCGSGFRASADGGEPCKTCHRPLSNPVENVDANWFKQLEKGGNPSQETN